MREIDSGCWWKVQRKLDRDYFGQPIEVAWVTIATGFASYSHAWEWALKSEDLQGVSWQVGRDLDYQGEELEF